MIEEDKDWRKVANFRPIMVSSGQKKRERAREGKRRRVKREREK